jgi:cyanophycinase
MKRTGILILIGGAEDKEGDCTILRQFVRLAGGRRARIVVMTVATSHPDEVGERYTGVFNRIGAGKIRTVDVSSRDDVHSEESLAAIRKATGVFFTGGDQLHITALLGGTVMDKILHDRYHEGLVLAGTSAGAAMMSNSMIIGGSAEASPQMEGVKMAPGMEFIIGAAIDTHFSQRGRHGRLLTAVAHYPHDLGIGLDEDTAVIFHENALEVLGSGCATIFDLGAVTYTNLPELTERDNLALFDIRLHVLPSGYCFDIVARRPFVPGDHPDARGVIEKIASRSGKRAVKAVKQISGKPTTLSSEEGAIPARLEVGRADGAKARTSKRNSPASSTAKKPSAKKPATKGSRRKTSKSPGRRRS